MLGKRLGCWERDEDAIERIRMQVKGLDAVGKNWNDVERVRCC